ncbi:GAF domain-containing protein [Bradyrhizobium liaoningense]|uniref:GAF domain-containing protein n=1 Tax=Bradyrhizobium liaoningense TaxID=43992 RepID=UPI001BAC54DE|nr:GAF domain-containing protein [Bradyrhizobium liaoningense]MBR1167494.1 GAF domain-containing protein [Bradyrhizobium liaoningense]
MSANKSRSALLEAATALMNGSASPAVLLGKAGQTADTLIGKLVSRLQQPDYSFTDLLSEAAEAKKKFAEAGMPLKQLASHWSTLDRTVEECLERTLVAHEKFLGETLHGFCEFDPSGLITFANTRMLDWAPDCVGKELAGFFGKMAPEVTKAIGAHGKRRLHQLELATDAHRRSVLVEFGSIDAKGPTSGYALLVDMSELVDAEYKALEASPYGMLKLDAKYLVRYANRRALEYMERPVEEVLGHDPMEFVSDRKVRDEVILQRVKRSEGRGSEYSVEIARPKSRKTMHLRVTAVPSFNTAGKVSGVLTALQPIDHEIARADIAHLVATTTKYRDLFAGIIEVVARFIEFDWADLSLYTEKGDYAVSFCRFPETQPEYPIRWWPIASYFRRWIKGDCTWFDDMLVDWRKRPDAKAALAKTPEIARTISRDGRKALIALPIRSENRLVGALSFSSKRAKVYDESTLKILRDRLALEHAMLAIFNLREHDEQQFVAGLLQEISSAADHRDLAGTIVSQLAQYYKFQNVSIFKINALRGHFSLLAQKLGPDGGSAIPPEYTQRLDEGLLGLTLKRGKRVLMGNRNDKSVEARQFKQVAPEIVSELCIPITLRGRILWILNLEDKHENAFAAPEIKTIEDIVKQVESIVERLFQGLVLTQVLDVFPDGVVIASNRGGRILLCSDTAKEIFQRSKITPETSLKSCLSPADYGRAISERSSLPWQSTIKGAKGKKTPVLISKFILPEEYDHVVLRVQDVSELEWKTDAARLEAALAEAASIVRVPLSLVSSYVRQMKQIGDQATVDLADKAFRQLSRIELTYDRIFAAYGSGDPAHEQKTHINLGQLIEYVLQELPECDRGTIRLTKKVEGPLFVMGNSYRLLFAMESMLAYFLRSRGSATPISLEVNHSGKKHIGVVLAGSVLSVEPNGALEKLVEATRREIALGESVLRTIASEYAGKLVRQRLNDNQEKLSLQLKLVRH